MICSKYLQGRQQAGVRKMLTGAGSHAHPRPHPSGILKLPVIPQFPVHSFKVTFTISQFAFKSPVPQEEPLQCEQPLGVSASNASSSGGRAVLGRRRAGQDVGVSPPLPKGRSPSLGRPPQSLRNSGAPALLWEGTVGRPLLSAFLLPADEESHGAMAAGAP